MRYETKYLIERFYFFKAKEKERYVDEKNKKIMDEET